MNEEKEIYKKGQQTEDSSLRDSNKSYQLSGMFQNWFLDYASYVILERAVPHLSDGFKPVQRRILHSMKRLDDGRYNKVANIVGHTMQFHPHGDASIGDALVQLGQKNLLIDCQGNWGNILTGDSAAASRYIEARLSKFALDVLFNPKTTEWKLSYDGRNKEPITLPVKFPLLLAQGAEGIAVGLSSKILPHNLNEICDAAINYLHDKPFELYPDFLTGGQIDVSKYADGKRGGNVKVRAKISKLDSKTLVISQIPYGKNTSSLIESILRANDKGKIKIRKVDDNTSSEVEIIIRLAVGTSSDKTIDALYAFTDCEVSISPNCCVVYDNKPRFLGVHEVLRESVNRTKALLEKELLIRRDELMESLHFSSLEKIFIEERIYKDRAFENAKDMDVVLLYIDERLTPFYPQFVREVTREDILRLMEIKMSRILKFNKDKADNLIARMKDEIAKIDHDLANMIEITANWYLSIKQKYGADYPRLTEIRSFDTIEATKVVESNEKLYINCSEGFMGTSLKKDEFVSNCSDIDDIILFYRDGTYKITRVSDKVFIGETTRSKAENRKADIIHIAVFKKNDKRTIYNVVYRDGNVGNYYVKRFNVTSITHDKEYDITKGAPKSKVMYFSVNPNGEAEVIKVVLKPNIRLKNLIFEYDFSELLIKGRQSQGNLLSKHPILKITFKSQGGSTLGGRKVWFDKDVCRINYDGRGLFLGEFNSDERVLVILSNGEFYTTTFEVNNHFEHNIYFIGKYDANKVWSVVLFDADQNGFPYAKRFTLDDNKRHQYCAGENPENKLEFITDEKAPRIVINFGGNDDYRAPLEVDINTFIGVKSFKARGKRLTKFEVDSINHLEPLLSEEDDEEIIEAVNVQEEDSNTQSSLFDKEN